MAEADGVWLERFEIGEQVELTRGGIDAGDSVPALLGALLINVDLALDGLLDTHIRLYANGQSPSKSSKKKK